MGSDVESTALAKNERPADAVNAPAVLPPAISDAQKAILQKLESTLLDEQMIATLRDFLRNPQKLDDVQGVLLHLSSMEPYRALLERGMQSDWLEPGTSMDAWEAFSHRCRAHLANLHRREWKLDEAQASLRELLEFTRHHAIEGLPRQSLVRYEIAYILFLNGDYAEARALLLESEDQDARDGREIGVFHSRNVRYQIERRTGTGDLAEMRSFFEGIIESCKSKPGDGNANCAKNARHQLFEVALEQGDVKAAEKMLAELRSDPFILKYPLRVDPDFFLHCESQLAAAQGDPGKALGFLKQLLPTIDRPQPRLAADEREAIAEDYLLAGSLLQSLGRTEEAKRVWESALGLPPDHGNCHWQALIRAKLS